MILPSLTIKCLTCTMNMTDPRILSYNIRRKIPQDYEHFNPGLIFNP